LYSMVYVREQKLCKQRDKLGLDVGVTSASMSKTVISSSTSSSGIEGWARGISRDPSWFPLRFESVAVSSMEVRIEQDVARK
jgi:hypothetical protein